MMEKFLPKGNGSVVLDVGCGTGFHLALLENGVGVDRNKAAVKSAEGKGKPVAIASAEELPFSNECVDSAICFFGVLNLCDLGASLREMNRVLKWKGCVLASAASIWDRSYRFREKLFADREPEEGYFIADGERARVHLFTREEITKTSMEHGFKVEHFDSLFSLQKPRWHAGLEPQHILKLGLERLVPAKDFGGVYFIVLRKVF